MAQNVAFNINLKVNGKDAVQKVTMNVDELRHVIDEAKSASEKFAASLINFNQKAERFRTISDSVEQLSNTLNSLTDESRTFGSAMAAANTMAGKSGEDFGKLQDQVAELSKTLPVAREELANGLYQVISNGVPEDNWLEFLNKSARASVGGLADLNEVVKVTSTVIKNYGLDWSDAQEIQDKIQLTAKNGVTSFEQLAQALPRVTSQASNLDVGIDELMASFATLTGVSGNTAEVSTQLAAIFTALIKPSSEATEMAQQMGIQFDAAAIKAAGGMQQFISQLDQTVKQYAASSGMLEQEIYGRLFGSAESLRALIPLTNQLAEKFKENVGNMANSTGTIDSAFEAIAATGKAKLQMLNNKLGEVSDFIQSVFGNAVPYLDFSSQILISMSSVAQLAVSLRSLGVVMTIVSNATNAMRTAKVGAVAVGRVMTAVMRGESVSATTATVATRSLSVAVKSLLVSTGVGIAIVALGEAISYLSQSSAEAADNVQQLDAAEQQSQAARRQEIQDIAQVRTQMDMSIATLKAFKGGKGEEHALVQKMNQIYGQTIGYYSTVDQWYTALTANSEAYCNQMINEIRLRNLANKAAELQAKQREIKYNDDGSLKRYSKKRQTRTITHVGGSDPNAPDITTETIEVKGTSALEKANAQLTTLYRQEVAVKKEMQEIINTAAKPIKHTKGYSSTMPTFSSGKPTTQPPSLTTTTTHTTPDPLEGSIDYYEKEIAELRKKISATADEGAAAILQKELEQKETALKDLKIRIGIEKPEPKEAKTALQQLQDQLQVAQQDFDNAVDVEAKVKAQAKVVALQQQIDEATNGKLTISADVEPQYIEQGSKVDKRQSYQNAQNRASRIQQDYEIGLIGKDEAQKQIDELNKQIASMSKGLKPIEIDLDTKSFDKVFGDIKSGWGSVEGVGNGIQGISDALEENGDAWKQITGVIGGALEVADGIAGIVKLIDMLTSSTEAETAATAVNTAITASNTGVSAANTATKSGEAMANATASGAKLPFPANLVAIAAGVAAVVGALSMISGAFADGGIVGGSSWTGDKLMARVNSGEMILNGAQQSRLFAIANGATVYGAASGVGRGLVEGVKVGPEIERLRAVVVKNSENRFGSISLRLRGSDLVGVIANETRGNRRRSNIRI